jgi:hypothetical protein
MNPTTMRAAAAARGSKVAAPADRPSQRRCSEDPTSGARVATKIRDLQLRASADTALVTFDGYASVTNTGYEMWDWAGPYTESIDFGAFAVTLARAGLDVPLVLQHMDLRRIARTTNGSLSLSEDETGLHVLAPSLDPADEDVAYILPKLRSGLVDEMSFKFRIVSGLWSPDWTEYHINEVDIHRGDVAIVGYGANPATAGSGVRTLGVDEVLRGLDDAAARQAFDALRVRLAPTAVRALVTDEDVALRH